MVHLQTIGSQSDLVQQVLGVLDPAFRSQITFQVMAITDQSTGHHHPVSARFESFQDVQRLQLSCAGQSHHPDVGGVLHAQRTGKVSRCVGAVVAAESHDSRFELGHPSFSHRLWLPCEERLFLSHDLLVSIMF